MEYWWIMAIVPLALAIIMALSEQKGNKDKIKIRRLKRKLAKYEKGDIYMSKIINDLVGKRCKIPVYGEIKVLDADEEWIKFEYMDKKSNKAVKAQRIDGLDEIELLEF